MAIIIQEDHFGVIRIESNVDAAWAASAGHTIYPSYEAAELATRGIRLDGIHEKPSQYAGRVEQFRSTIWTRDWRLVRARQPLYRD